MSDGPPEPLAGTGPRPGDFAVIASHSEVGEAVDVMERLAGCSARDSIYTHACVCSHVEPDGTIWIVEAMPNGAVEVKWHYDSTPHLWSSGKVPTSEMAGTKALRYVGWGYGWEDYAVLAAVRFHLPDAPELMDRYERTHTVICSQLVDQAELDAGVHLFTDGRPAGYVRPADLAGLILTAKEKRS